MTTYWRSSLVLVDTKNLKSTVTFYAVKDGATPDVDFTEMLVAHNGLAAYLGAITDATIYSSQLTSIVSGSSEKPADADITDVAFVQLYLNDPEELPKFATIRIPAPKDALFESDLVTIDKTNADLINFVDQIHDDFVVSDGEIVNTEVDDGIAGGYWASVKKSTR